MSRARILEFGGTSLPSSASATTTQEKCMSNIYQSSAHSKWDCVWAQTEGRVDGLEEAAES